MGQMIVIPVEIYSVYECRAFPGSTDVLAEVQHWKRQIRPRQKLHDGSMLFR